MPMGPSDGGWLWSRKKSPPWAREEIILALDVYVREGLIGG
jgi:hypothetical protein